MKLNIDVGHPEALLLCGTYLMVSNNYGFGLALLLLGLLGGIFRAGLKFHEEQQKAEEKEKVIKEVSNAGEELAQGIIQILGALVGDKDSKGSKGQSGDLH
jgi:hypothetical protein